MLVTIIIPAYNSADTLEGCVCSAVNQTYDDIEIIIVDDGSFDATPTLSDELALSYPNIHVVHQQNRGLSGARNTGIEIARGSAFFFLDSDDYIEPQTIELLVHKMFETEADMVVGGFVVAFPDGSQKGVMGKKWPVVVDEHGYWEHACITNPENHVACIVSCGKLYKRHLFCNERFDEGMLHEDEFIVHRIVQKCRTISFLNYTGYVYVQHDSSITHTPTLKSRLDAAQAMITRARYFVERGWEDIAWPTMVNGRSCLMEALRFRSEAAENERLNLLLSLWRHTLKQLIHIDKRISRRYVTCVAFALFPKLFVCLYDLKEKA